MFEEPWLKALVTTMSMLVTGWLILNTAPAWVGILSMYVTIIALMDFITSLSKLIKEE